MAQSEKMRYNANVSEILSTSSTVFTKKEKRSKKEKNHYYCLPGVL